MPTKNPRLNVVLDGEQYEFIKELSQREDKSLSVVAKELISDAIEKLEDYLLSQFAMKRESKSQKTIKHDKAWK